MDHHRRSAERTRGRSGGNSTIIMVIVGVVLAVVVTGVVLLRRGPQKPLGAAGPGSVQGQGGTAQERPTTGGTDSRTPPDKTATKEPSSASGNNDLLGKSLSQLTTAQLGGTFRMKVEQDMARYQSLALWKGTDGKFYRSAWKFKDVSYDVKHNPGSVMVPYFGVLTFRAWARVSQGCSSADEAKRSPEDGWAGSVAGEHTHIYQWQQGKGWVFSKGTCWVGLDKLSADKFGCEERNTTCGCPEGHFAVPYLPDGIHGAARIE